MRALDSPNGPTRDLVQQLLIERQDARAIAPLRQLVTNSPHPKTRLSALCTLDGLQAADRGDSPGGAPRPARERSTSMPFALRNRC